MSNAKGPGDPFDTRLVRKLADILRDTELTEIEVERGDLKIRVAREITVAAHAAPLYSPAPPAAPLGHEPIGAGVPTTTDAPVRSGEVIKSPMVGTVYLQGQPGEPPFVRVGDRVKAGQTLLIVEAMKTMNPIPAPRDGLVLEVLVADSQPVEYGEPLVVIE